jgi:hypothetical protein
MQPEAHLFALLSRHIGIASKVKLLAKIVDKNVA